jgi:aminoglycoside phosphotransferase (APT) family kinase protein
MASRTVTRGDLASAARAVFGASRRLQTLERVAGGTMKGVYRLTMDDLSSVIAYAWDDAESYWPAGAGGAAGAGGERVEPFVSGFGLDMYEDAHAKLASLGLRVPEIHLVDRDRVHFPADLAIVEDFPGEDLGELLERDPRAAAPSMELLAEALAALRAHRSPCFGKVGPVDAGAKPGNTSSVGAVLDFSLRNVAAVAARDQRIADARGRLEARLQELAAAIRPRADYSVVHGELGLDHVLLDRRGNPVLIDIEDLMYFDAEWEHAYMRIQLHEGYRLVEADGLDEHRLALYTLAHRLWLVAGSLRLLEGDFPDRAFLAEIAESSLNAALALIRD